MKGKAIWWLITLLFLSSGLKIQIADHPIIQQNYAYTCSGAKGDVKYYFWNLPSGVKVDNNRISLDKKGQPTQGDYYVLIKAEDTTGQATQTRILMSIKKVRSTNPISGKNESRTVLNLSKNDEQAKNQNISGSLPKIQNSSNGFQLTTKTPKMLAANLRKAQLPSNQALPDQSSINPDYQAINKIMSSLNLPQQSQIIPNPPQPRPNSIDKLPVANIPSRINVDALLISTKKTSTVSNSLRKSPPTDSDLKVTTAFNRQISASKAVTNLLAIVKQATANRNSALNQFKMRQLAYEQARNNQQQKNQSLFESQLEYSQNLKFLLNTTQNMKNLKMKSQQLSSNITFKNKQKQQIIKNIQQNQDKSVNADTLIQLTHEQNIQLNDTKLRKEGQCEILDKQYGVVMDEKQIRIDQIVDVRMRLVPARREVELTQDIIDDLKKQLAKAEQSMKQSLFVVQYYQIQQKQLTENLTQIEEHASTTKIKVDSCHEKLDNITMQINRNQNEKIVELRKSKAEALATIKLQADNLSQLNIQLIQLPKQLEEVKKSLVVNQNNAVIFQNILADLQPKIFIQQGQSFDANEEAEKSKQNLQAILKKIQVEQKNMEEATNNLQKARIQKQQADQQVNNLLVSNSNVPLYATTTNNQYPTINSLVSKQLQKLANEQADPEAQNASNSTLPENSTNLTGDKILKNSNNPSLNSSAPNITNTSQNTTAKQLRKNQYDYFIYSGAVRYLKPVGIGSYQVSNITAFIRQIFGPEIQLPIIQSFTQLYPIKPLFALTYIQWPPSNQISVSGYAISIRGNSLEFLTESGQIYEVTYSSVINIFSLDPQAQISAGSKILLKGIQKESSKLIATFVFFLSL